MVFPFTKTRKIETAACTIGYFPWQGFLLGLDLSKAELKCKLADLTLKKSRWKNLWSFQTKAKNEEGFLFCANFLFEKKFNFDYRASVYKLHVEQEKFPPIHFVAPLGFKQVVCKFVEEAEQKNTPPFFNEGLYPKVYTFGINKKLYLLSANKLLELTLQQP